MEQGLLKQSCGSLVAELCGPHVLVRLRDEATAQDSSMAQLPRTPNELFVAVSRAAQQTPALHTELPALLEPLINATGVVPRVLWLAVAGFGNGGLPQHLSQRFGLDVVVPDVQPTMVAGTGAYAGRSSGGSGWYLFRAGSRPWLFSTRYPVPSWERALPIQRMVHGTAVVEPVPAGVLIHDVRNAPWNAGHVAVRVSVADRFPRLLVGGSPLVSPGAVSGFLKQLADPVLSALVLVPIAADASRYQWLVDLAVQSARHVNFSTGAILPSLGSQAATVVLDSFGQQRFRPFATLVHQPAGGGDQKVLEIAEAPPGWQRCGPRSYLFVAEDSGDRVLAEVVPSGIVLHRTGTTLDINTAALALPFSPDEWVLNVGSAGEPVCNELLKAAESLLHGIDPASCAAARLRVYGELDRSTAARVRSLAAGAGIPVDLPSTPPPVSNTDPVVGSPVELSSTAAPAHPASASSDEAADIALPAADSKVTPDESHTPNVPGNQVGPGTSRLEDLVPEAVTRPADGLVFASQTAETRMVIMSAPVSTVSGLPSRRSPSASEPEPDPDAPQDLNAPDDPEATTGAAHGTQAVDDEAAQEDDTVPERPSDVVYDPVEEEVAPAPLEDEPISADQSHAAVQTADDTAEEADAPRALEVKDRKSTTTEQNRFTSAAGDAFSEALATVNAAMATWPSLRHGEDSGAKADYVAVCLFLGKGEGGAEQLNLAVRSGAVTELDGHVPCLVSGMRRLPTHRRPVLRQSNVPGSLEERATPGTLLAEPGFLTASMDLDVTVPGAQVDLLIWPSGARRTSELSVNRQIDEVVFLAGARLKALAVREADGDEVEDDDETPAPRIAVLFRELAPGEHSSGAELDEKDLAALAKLDSALARRRRSKLRVVDDEDLVVRLTRSMVEATDDHAAAEMPLIASASAGQS
ncbi:hypothetical protein [Saccharopolyspora sp. NPDC002686]|uniref:hypothetical protein n=1 Tax=Saccharopolyspora sp. NPDC002686 TaxID=3154541 RepID=UPI003328B062